ncbi:hypothetical protein PT126_08745 [Erysipelothrix rhusiopathiae]|nr:hypothetical protein [Erysipelothrix rhusiopathiae]MDE8282798.1 hypothetical protein [Erysipelothrix rhusiopathiae]
MKISDVEKRVNASYNTIKRFIEKDDTYNEVIDNILHATDLGIEQLEMEYGVRTEVLSDDNVDFYKNQILFLRQQLEENRQYSQAFIKQIESKDYEAKENKKKIKELEDQVHQQDLEKLELQHKLEIEKNKSFLKKILGK